MELTLNKDAEVEQIKNDLTEAFPNYKVKYPMFNKKIINVVNGPVMAIVIPKNDKVKVVGNINLMLPWMFVAFVVLIALTLLGGFIFYGAMYYTKKKDFQALQQEISGFITEKYN